MKSCPYVRLSIAGGGMQCSAMQEANPTSMQQQQILRFLSLAEDCRRRGTHTKGTECWLLHAEAARDHC